MQVQCRAPTCCHAGVHQIILGIPQALTAGVRWNSSDHHATYKTLPAMLQTTSSITHGAQPRCLDQARM